MTVQEAKEFFDGSDFSDASKAKIAQILAAKDMEVLDDETTDQIKAVMEEELEADFQEAGVDLSDDPEAQAELAKYNAELEQIEKDLADDMASVDKELKDLDGMRKEVMKVSDEMDADAIKQSM